MPAIAINGACNGRKISNVCTYIEEYRPFFELLKKCPGFVFFEFTGNEFLSGCRNPPLSFQRPGLYGQRYSAKQVFNNVFEFQGLQVYKSASKIILFADLPVQCALQTYFRAVSLLPYH